MKIIYTLIILILSITCGRAATYPTASDSAVTVVPDGALTGTVSANFASKNNLLLINSASLLTVSSPIHWTGVNTFDNATGTFSGVFSGNGTGLQAVPWSALGGRPSYYPADLSATSNSLPLSQVSGTGGVSITTQSETISGLKSFTTPIQAKSDTTTYVLSTFNNNNPTYPVLYSSVDASAFVPIRSTPGFTDTNVRDPQIIKIGEWYYLSYTTSYPASTNYLGLKKSKDMVNWTAIATPNWSSLWAGSENQIWNGGWFVDNGTVYLLFSTAITSQRPYAAVLNPANDTLGTPTAVTGDADFVSQKCTLVSVWKVGSVYHALVQNNNSRGTGLWVEHATSSSLLSGWSIINQSNWAGWGNAEGGAMIVMPSGNYRAYFCQNVAGAYYIFYSDSSSADLTSATWTAPTQVPSQSNPQDWVGVLPYSDLQTELAINAAHRPEVADVNSLNTFTQTNTFSGPTVLNGTVSTSGNITGIYGSKLGVDVLGSSYPGLQLLWSDSTKYTVAHSNILGSSDLAFQLNTSANNWGYIEEYGGLGLALGTQGSTASVLIRPNRTTTVTYTSTGSQIFNIAGQGLVAGTTSTLPAVGIVGNTTLSSLAASSSAVLTSGTTTYAAAVTLPAGHYRLWSTADFKLATASASLLQSGIGTSSNSIPAAPAHQITPISLTNITATYSQSIPGVIVAPTTTTSYYLTTQYTGSGGTVTASGTLQYIEQP